ncbi:hypothetical protein BFJ63_vAg19442 [Fusarium oxysporum f. sp. narcissi]|uniref:Uncharacterized protein n=1 Tax=Fusarium oxysporum f. sp. narcissi TaxID=451672 RepID=A0A4Q2UTU4_FUSOX|nr:hypothetical protein BFJ63_vAg19442 [Fusarium oxysporum f. sp. narcissi]
MPSHFINYYKYKKNHFHTLVLFPFVSNKTYPFASTIHITQLRLRNKSFNHQYINAHGNETMHLAPLLAGLFAAALVAADSTKKCQPFTFTSKSTGCLNDSNGCVMGKCKDKFIYLECTCPDDYPHVKCGTGC